MNAKYAYNKLILVCCNKKQTAKSSDYTKSYCTHYFEIGINLCIEIDTMSSDNIKTSLKKVSNPSVYA